MDPNRLLALLPRPTLPVGAREAGLLGGIEARVGVAVLERTLRSPRASVDLPRALRGARELGASQRRLVRERLYLVVQAHEALELLLLEGGWDGSRPGEALWLAVCVLGGSSAQEAGERFGAPVFAALSDPDPVLLRWMEGRPPEQCLATMASLPIWLARELDADFALACLGRGPLTLRVNPLRSTREALAEELAALDPVPGTWSPWALHLRQRVDLHTTAAFKRGACEVQDEGSQLIAELVRPPRRSAVIDYCAGAGGKALAIACAAPRGCRVYIHDVRAKALARARQRAARAGVELRSGLVEGARRVLVDAPCSGTGTLRRDPARRWRLSEDEVEACCALQRRLIREASSLVAPGGRLIYATCSVLERENDAIVEGFLEERGDWRLVPVKEVLGAQRCEALGEERVLRLRPEIHGTDGFYAAILQRG